MPTGTTTHAEALRVATIADADPRVRALLARARTAAHRAVPPGDWAWCHATWGTPASMRRCLGLFAGAHLVAVASLLGERLFVAAHGADDAATAALVQRIVQWRRERVGVDPDACIECVAHDDDAEPLRRAGFAQEEPFAVVLARNPTGAAGDTSRIAHPPEVRVHRRGLGVPEPRAWAAAHAQVWATSGLRGDRVAALRERPEYIDAIDLCVTDAADVSALAIAWADGGARWWVSPLGVVPAARRRGLARALVETIAREAGPSAEIALAVAPDNDAALALYAGLDFVEAGRLGLWRRWL